MNDKAIIERINKGEAVVLLEWRSCNVDTVKLTDGKTGRVRQAVAVKHACEKGNDQVSITEWLPDGTDPKGVVVPWKKGDKVLLTLTGYGRVKGTGIWQGQGTFSPA